MLGRRRPSSAPADADDLAAEALGFLEPLYAAALRLTRNRSDAEVFDYILPGESRLLKTVQWYGILTGLYWLLPPLGCLLYLLWPGLFHPSERLRSTRAFRQTSAAAMLSGFENAPRGTIRLEILFTLVFQIAIEGRIQAANLADARNHE